MWHIVLVLAIHFNHAHTCTRSDVDNQRAFVYLRNTSGRWRRHWFKIQHGAARVTPLYLSPLPIPWHFLHRNVYFSFPSIYTQYTLEIFGFCSTSEDISVLFDFHFTSTPSSAVRATLITATPLFRRPTEKPWIRPCINVCML